MHYWKIYTWKEIDEAFTLRTNVGNELVATLSLPLFLANAFPTTDITFPATQFTIPNQKQIAVRTGRPVRMRAAYKCPTMAPNYVRL